VWSCGKFPFELETLSQNELYCCPKALTKRRNHHPPCHPELVSGSTVDDEPRMADTETSSV